METYTLHLEVLTAVHIGTGEEIMPMEYGVFPTSKSGLCFGRFAAERIAGGLSPSERAEFLSLSEKDDWRDCAKFLRKRVPANLEAVRYLMPCTKRFAEDFSGKIDDPDNQLKIFTAYRTPGAKTMALPGSSIKGAIRTAVLDEAVHGRPNEAALTAAADAGRGSDFQAAALFYRYPCDDPFRCLTVPDLELEGGFEAQLAGRVVNYCLKRDTADGEPRILAEAARGSLLGGNAQGSATLRLNRAKELLGKAPGAAWNGISRPLSAENLIKSCDAFYRTAFKAEAKRYFLYSGLERIREGAEKLAAEVEKIRIDAGEFLIRIGRCSQAEFVTVNPPFRRLARKGGGETTSRMLFEHENGFWPLGYCRARLLPVKT